MGKKFKIRKLPLAMNAINKNLPLVIKSKIQKF